ncbi:MAG: PEGA domain-containing protein [Treponema sp.]|jgi:hypothetical protein|nr:PEGA domain-containing protein [Treponema sp.]
MVNKKLILCSLLIAHCSFVVSASGVKAEEEQKPINNEWLLCITQFDYSMLPPSQRISGDVISRSLINELKSVSYRFRISPEYAYYEGYAWWQAVNAAAKALSQKQDERSLQLYRGDPDWRYRNNIKRIDAEIEKLKEDLAKKEAEKPLVNNEPSFNLIQANIDGTFPAPPKPGGERRFCQSQKADAFLLGSIREFHGRFYIALKLYVLYANAYVYEDDIIFSMEDSGGAVDEITGRLSAALSGSKPAVIAVNASPPEAQVLINKNYAGRGTVEAREHPPGKVAVAVAAEGYTPELAEPELVSGEITEIEVNLSPLLYSNVRIDVPDFPGVSLYQGALYVGEAPYNLYMPINTLNYITAETRNGRAAKIVFSTPDMPDEAYNISLKLKPSPGQKKVNNARKHYYWSWGATWIAAILAWGVNGIYNSRNDVLPNSSSQEFYSGTLTWYYVSAGSYILLGASAAYNLYRLGRYLYTSTEGATPIAKQGKK